MGTLCNMKSSVRDISIVLYDMDAPFDMRTAVCDMGAL